MTSSSWVVVVVDAPTGAGPVTVPGAAVRSVSWALNEADTAELELRVDDPHLTDILADDREVMIWRDGALLFWGPVVRAEVGDERASLQCAGAWWWFGRRYFGKAERTNLIANGDFEDGLASWGWSGPISPALDPFRRLHGTRSMRLTGEAVDHDSYLYQTYTHSPQYHPEGDLLTLTAWAWVASAGYLGDAVDSRGLWVQHRRGAEVLFESWDPIWADTRKDAWVRLDEGAEEIEIPFVMAGDEVEVRLYPPAGEAWYDLVTLTLMESLSFVEQDLATIVRGAVLYAQDRYGFDHGKGDLEVDVDAAPTGVHRTRVWQFADHDNIGDAIADLADQAGTFDYHVAVDPAGAGRTFVMSYPERGQTIPVEDLDIGVTLPVVSRRWSKDREREARTVVVLGAGDGPDREEAGVTVDLPGPRTEDVVVAPDGTTVTDLPRLAAERAAALTHPEVVEALVPGLLGVVEVGDWAHTTITTASGTLTDDYYRVVAMTIDPATDAVAVTLNRREPQTPEEAMARFPLAVDACLAPGGGVWVVGSDGGVGAFGGAAFHGSMGGELLNAPMVAIVAHGAGGYWLVGADTGVFAFGDAPAREPYTAMVDTEYAAGDRAIVAAEAYDPGGDDTLIMVADDGATYIAAVP